MNKAIEALTTELTALEHAALKLSEAIDENENTDFAFYVNVGLQKCESHMKEIQKALFILSAPDKK